MEGRRKRVLESAGSRLQHPVTPGQPAAEVFRTGAFWFIFASFFLTAFSQMGILQHQVPMLMDVAGATQATAATALGLTAGIGGIGKLCFGIFSDRWQFRYVVFLCFGLQAVAVLMLLHIDTPTVMWVYTVLFGFSMGGVIVLMPLVVGRFWGLLSFGVLMGAIWIANSLGGALGTYFNGLAYDYTGSYSGTLNFFVAAYVLSIISFFLAGRSGEERDKRQHPKRKNI
jgi:MFS transporter, OFA family, oxalate/formate antiporter